MPQKEFKPFVPASTTMPELTFKAVFLGALMAIILGAANAYLGMKVGMTVAAGSLTIGATWLPTL